MRYLLDNDTSTLVLRGHSTLTERLLNTPHDDVWLSSIAVEEMLAGSLAAINTERSKPRVGLEVVYGRLGRIVQHLARFNVLPFDNAAERLYRTWPASVHRVGKADCRTAALAITHGLIIVTCNAKDFSHIPAAVFEDWTK